MKKYYYDYDEVDQTWDIYKQEFKDGPSMFDTFVASFVSSEDAEDWCIYKEHQKKGKK